jgi:hypothetical protein
MLDWNIILKVRQWECVVYKSDLKVQLYQDYQVGPWILLCDDESSTGSHSSSWTCDLGQVM